VRANRALRWGCVELRVRYLCEVALDRVTDSFLQMAHRRLTWYVAILSTFSLTLLVARSVSANQRQEETFVREFSPANTSSAQGDGLSTVASKCPLGHFGGECQHSLKSFYFEHDVYGQFQPLKDASLSGWSPGKSFYERLVHEVHPKLIVEVGVWRGLSLVHLAESLKEIMSGGAVIAVDTWLGAPEFWNRRHTNGAFDTERDLKWKHGYPQVYYDFLSNIAMHRLKDVVVPLPVPSVIAAQLLREKDILADILHIDAAHEYESVREDIATWFPLLTNHGILLGDDFNEHWPGVVKAACEFAHESKVKVYCSGKKWWIKKAEVVRNAETYPETIESCISKAYRLECKD